MTRGSNWSLFFGWIIDPDFWLNQYYRDSNAVLSRSILIKIPNIKIIPQELLNSSNILVKLASWSWILPISNGINSDFYDLYKEPVFIHLIFEISDKSKYLIRDILEIEMKHLIIPSMYCLL